MKFAHLHVHSHYSLLDGLPKIDEIVNAAIKNNMPAVALTDHGNMSGIIEFYQKCKKNKIKPILGVECYVAPNGLHSKRPRIDEKPYHLILLAENNIGYHNLLKLVSISNLEGYYYKPRIDLDIIRKYQEGIIGLSACLQGEISQAAVNHGYASAENILKKYLEVFEKDNFYLELQYHKNIPKQQIATDILIKLARNNNVKLVATNDVHYIDEQDAEIQDILLCIQMKKMLSDTDRMTMTEDNFSFLSLEKMKENFADLPEIFTNVEEIIDKCNVELELGTIQLPHYELPEGITADSELEKLSFAGLILKKDLFGKTEYIERLNYELGVIKKTGFASYFLIVQDFVNWAKKNKIVVGPGRGSAAGSLVSYLTGITNIDPIKYNLLFERFLNPERISMPDIDMDFADDRRGEVINYVSQKYGKDHVAQIITFGTMAARAGVRDVGRVMGLSYSYCDKVAKMIPVLTSLDESIKIVPELKEIYQNDPDGTRLLDGARKLEGVARHASMHACGVVITNKPLSEYTPLQYASADDKTIVTQYSLHPIEDLGLLKMDFLGLKNLSIIENTINIIEKTTQEQINIDDIDFTDKKTFKLLQKAHTTGVFQLESSGMKRYLRELKPTEFEDIIAMVALYRPGPMEWIPNYITGKQGKSKPQYLHPLLKNILDKTYGVAIYQEQLMQIARDLAGFTLGEADVLRKAVAKKIPVLLAEQKKKFILGCVKNKIGAGIAEKIFNFIEPFAGYGFNRSHAACYAMIAYQTAFLKAHWPAQFMAALLTSDYGDTDRIAVEVEEVKQMDIDVLPPDVNESFSTFTVVSSSLKTKPTIRFGLTAVKNLGNHIVDVIIQERKNNGNFKNLEDLLTRINDKDLNKKSLESLIKSGALDLFEDRNVMLNNVDNLLAFVKFSQKEKDSGQINIFGQLPVSNNPMLTLKKCELADVKQKLQWEKELLGMYISADPLAEYQKIIESCSMPIKNIAKFVHKNVRIIGILSTVKKIFTKKGEAMVFAKVENQHYSVEAILFPKIYQEFSYLVNPDVIVDIKGKVNNKDGEIKIIVDEITIFNPDAIKNTYILINIPKTFSKENIEKLKILLAKSTGNLQIFLKINDKKIKSKYFCNYDYIPEIEKITGQKSINLI